MKRISLEPELMNQSNTAYTDPKFSVYRVPVPAVSMNELGGAPEYGAQLDESKKPDAVNA